MTAVPVQPTPCYFCSLGTLDDHLTGFREDTDPGAQAALQLWRCGSLSHRWHAQRHLAIRTGQVSFSYRN